MTKIYNKNNSKVLNQVEKILISNLQKKYYLREKNIKLLNNILRISKTEKVTPQIIIPHAIITPQQIIPNIIIPLTPQKIPYIQKTSTIDCVVKNETLMTYFVNEFVNILFSN